MDAGAALRFVFKGTPFEYFRIWIVNLTLTVLTLGLYSPWAKVRTKRYFYRNTYLAGHSFEYTGDPKRILLGRLILGGGLVLMVVAEQVFPLLSLVFVVVALVAAPWLRLKALSFNARNSLYRGVRFGFEGSVKGSYGTHLAAMLVTLVSLGLALPFANWLTTRFVLTHHRFGKAPLKWSATAWDFFAMFLVALGLWTALAVPLLYVAGLQRIGDASTTLPESGSEMSFLTAAAVYVPMILPAAYIAARKTNLIFGRLHVGPHALAARLRLGEVLWLNLTNWMAAVFTLGLAIPWVMVRVARYRASRLELHPSGSLEVEALPSDPTTALGEAAVEAGLVDFDLGL